MERNRLMICLLVLGMYIAPINAQVNINFDNSCPNKDCAILANAFLGALGDKAVANLLEADISISVLLYVDTLGRVTKLKLKKVRSFNSFSESNVRKIEKYLIKNDIRFYICFEMPYNQEKKRSYNLIVSTDSFVKKNKALIVAGFPGSLMDDYDLESKKTPQSELEYFKKRIKRYLSQE